MIFYTFLIRRDVDGPEIVVAVERSAAYFPAGKGKYNRVGVIKCEGNFAQTYIGLDKFTDTPSNKKRSMTKNAMQSSISCPNTSSIKKSKTTSKLPAKLTEQLKHVFFSKQVVYPGPLLFSIKWASMLVGIINL